MSDPKTDTKVIIELLAADKAARELRQEKSDEDMDHLHECVHNIDSNVNAVRSYFIGIDPQKHIIHHVRMEEAVDMNKNIKRAIIGSLVSLGFTGAMAFMQWSAIQAQRDMQEHIISIVKAQAPANQKLADSTQPEVKKK